MPFQTLPGKTPRRIEIERKKREFASHHIEELLLAQGVDYSRFPHNVDHKTGLPTFLVLHHYDDADYHYRSPEEWIQLGTSKRAGTIAIPGKALRFPPGVGANANAVVPSRSGLSASTSTSSSASASTPLGTPANGQWIPCTVVGYNAATGCYRLQWRDSEADAQQQTGGNNSSLSSSSSSSSPVYVNPIDVLFDSEDPVLFARRVGRAHALRREVESAIKYSLYIDSMPVDDLEALDSQQVSRIVELAQNTRQLQRHKLDTTSLLQEINVDYARTMNKIIFDVNLSDPAQQGLRSALAPGLNFASITNGGANANGAVVPSLGFLGQHKKPVRYSAVVSVPFHDFPNHFSDFCFNSVFTKVEALAALIKVNAECLKLQKMSLFNLSVPKATRLDEFEQMQTGNIQLLTATLKDKWVFALKSAIVSSLRENGKGWLNLYEKNLEVYNFSKLKKFMTMTSFMMQDAVRFLVEDSLGKYASLIRRACSYRVDVRDTSSISVVHDKKLFETLDSDEQKVSTPSGLGRGGAASLRDAVSSLVKNDLEAFFSALDRLPQEFSLFAAELVIREDKVTLSTPLEQFVAGPLHLMDKALGALTDIPQLETQVMQQLFPFSTDLKLATVRRDEPWVEDLYARMTSWLEAALLPVRKYLDQFKKYQAFLKQDLDQLVREWGADVEDLEEVARDIEANLKASENVEKEIPRSMNLGLVTISCEEVRRQLALRYRTIALKQQDLFAQQARARCQEVQNKFRDIDTQLDKSPENIKQLVQLREYTATVPSIVASLKPAIQDVASCFDLLDKFHYRLPTELFKTKWNTFFLPKKTIDARMTKDIQLDNDMKQFLTNLQSEQVAFQAELSDVEKKVLNFQSYTEVSKHEAIAEKARKLHERIQGLKKKAEDFTAQEMLFGVTVFTDYRPLNLVANQFEPYYLLWTTTHDWSENYSRWYSGSFLELKGDDIQATVQRYTQSMAKVVKSKIPTGCAVIAESVKKVIDSFRPNLPLISALRNPGMRDRHWELLRKELPGPFPVPDETLTLQKVLEQYKLLDHLDTISVVGDTASKEYQIESALDRMEEAWRGKDFTVKDYKNTGTYVLADVDPIIQLLDEHSMTTQSLQYSPYKKYFEERIARWTAKLATVNEVIEEWLAVQRQWLGLQAIFASPDIMKQLSAEGKRFQQVNKMWRSTMSSVHSNPDVLNFCDSHGLLQKLQDANLSLQAVQKRLSDYLDKKRMAFPRFYFLSDDELINILSQTQDPTAVQPHLKKCFENINLVDFAPDLTITAMLSAEGERVPFVKPVDPKGQNVEDWLSQVLKQMKESVRHVLDLSVKDYAKIPRTQWVQKWPGQCVINGSQLHWTAEVESALRNGGFVGIQRYQAQLREQLLGLVEIVRGNTTPILSLILGALIVIDVHARDIVDSLVQAKVSAPTDFQWICQMRYYQEDSQIWVQMVQSRFPYGYEYLGNTSRLVITPLTDRCYMTLMTALSLSLGGAPAGPAGTGKTESVKDLAKALSKQCVVFNCSEGLNYLAMGKFFKGLASSGAWSCFDEFNRIDIEVLSVVAQQIMTIYDAVKLGVSHFTFEDAEINLEPTCAVFVTMNPGYAGRTELPDNLKALFRPVAMMVPDYELIAQIMLYSFGFDKAESLARKMVTTFKLASEQLSTQDHYDYGMRAVKTVITRAGILKRESPRANEDGLLLRALLDVNVPKFLRQDIPLFQGIISDLFPDVPRPDPSYGSLQNALVLACKEQNLQATPSFLHKCVQIYETLVVRHGIMVVGPAGGGKSCARSALRAALGRLHGFSGFRRVEEYAINPKSLTMSQLYGNLDTNTKEWSDGVIALVVRTCINEGAPDTLQWVMFDGPVDALWVENLNTVLDDNKKLCLVSQEILSLTENMRMMFEVDDLAQASPATVSRCGMVYVEPAALGLAPLVRSWLDKLHPLFQSVRTPLQTVFDALLEPSITFVRRHLAEPVPSVDTNLALSTLSLLESLMIPYLPVLEDGSVDWNATSIATTGAKGRSVNEDELQAQNAELTLFRNSITAYAIMCLIWAVGATTDKVGRARFTNYLHLLLQTNNISVGPPQRGLVYDYFYDLHKQWVPWMDTRPPFKVDARLAHHEILVPTADSVRSTYFLDVLVRQGKHVLFTGQTGTGKTANILQYLGRLPDRFQPTTLMFSAATSANQTEDFLFAKFTKRRQKVYGAPLGKRLVVFVDDLNMPAREKYLAQPPIELLRQWMDYGGWYNRHSLQFMQIVDINIVSAMGPPGGGRNPVTARFLRHFHQIAHTELDNSALNLIFSTIVREKLSHATPEVANLAHSLVEASISVYQRTCAEFLPTPTRSHYTFNLRDLSAVVQGLLPAQPPTDVRTLLCLWVHETRRVFEDRLISDSDVVAFEKMLAQTLRHQFNCNWDDVVPPTLLFGDYMVIGERRAYTMIPSLDEAHKAMSQALSELNEESQGTQMDLVLFRDAIEHVSRISRVLRQPGGHALLLGVGGSGRQSLTKLAAYMGDFTLVQIEMSKGFGMAEWREAIKTMLLDAGLKEQQTVFLFTDTQIIQESFLEDINNLLNSGEVPSLYSNEDLDSIFAACKADCQKKMIPQNKLNAYGQFLLRVKANLHIVLCMSPLGDAFRNRLRMFPSLVNCCYIDWFFAWPQDALQSVAQSILVKNNDLHLDNATTHAIVDVCTYIHQNVAEQSEHFRTKLRRHNYVTPTSYLQLISLFSSLLRERRSDVDFTRSKLQGGLDTLADAKHTIELLERDLKEKQPKLAVRQSEVSQMRKEIEQDRHDVAETKKVVERQEVEAQTKAQECKAIADEANAELRVGEIELEDSLECVKELNKADIDEVRSMKKPPTGVMLTMEAASIMLESYFPDKKYVMKVENGVKKPDYWDFSLKVVSKDGKQMLEMMKYYDKAKLTDRLINRIKVYVENPAFTPKKIEAASKACRAICMWVHAMHKYYIISLAVEPKRIRQREAEAELKRTVEELDEAKSRLDTVNRRLEQLQQSLDSAVSESEFLQKQVEECVIKMDRAKKLTGGLESERERWTRTIAQKNHEFTHILGDVLVSAGSMAYLGPFTHEFRSEMLHLWRQRLDECKIMYSDNCCLLNTFGDPVKIRRWNAMGLPSDPVSTENAIIMGKVIETAPQPRSRNNGLNSSTSSSSSSGGVKNVPVTLDKSLRWPLIIDPQGQAAKFLKRLGETREDKVGMQVIRTSEDKWVNILENAVQMGFWILIENMLEEIDPMLEPLLTKSYTVQNNQVLIKLSKNVPYNENFRLIMTTKLPNPHFPPEAQVKVSLLNFTITQQGLEAQMLGAVVNKEAPELEATKSKLVTENADLKLKLQKTEDLILKLLLESRTAKGDILDNEDLINVLTQSKKTSEEMNVQLASAEEVERNIDLKRKAYEPVAVRAAVLYFCIADLASVDSMYQYSFQWFLNLFIIGVGNAPASDDISIRLTNINNYFTYSLFQNVCRSLFEVHKMLFGFLLAVAIRQSDGLINGQEWRYLVAGGPALKTAPNPAPSWLTNEGWANILSLSELPVFQGFERSFADNISHFKQYFDDSTPHLHPLPTPWEQSLDDLQKLIVLRALRSDKMAAAMQLYVGRHLGQEFTESAQFNIHASYKDSSSTTPLIFILSKGADPASALFALGNELNCRDKIYSVSLGQGQEVKAKHYIKLATKNGGWVLLQNCHLAASYLPELEQTVNNFKPDEVHEDFRLWLTSMPTPKFPVSILQMGVKMTNEPPKGLKANLFRSYTGFTDQFLNKSKKPRDFKKLLYSLCFFHAVILDRRKFGALGWNIAYEFTENDLQVCVAQLKDFVDLYENVPYQVIHFLVYDINYGGRVTDDNDRRTIRTILDDFINPDVLQDDYAFSPSRKYMSLPAGNRAHYLEHISALDTFPAPEVFGMHDNAEISSAQAETVQMFETILALLPREVQGMGKTREEIIAGMATHILQRMPMPWEIDSISKKYPTMYSESMNTVLLQECILYNRLITIIRDSLENLNRALKGQMLMTTDLDKMADALFNNVVPERWNAVAYPSLMPLGYWVQDLLARISFLNHWIQAGIPKVFWMGGFFFPQAFLTGTLQNHARRSHKPIDTIHFTFRVLDRPADSLLERPTEGVYVHGLFLEGARWDPVTRSLADPRPRELVAPLPVLWLLPEEGKKEDKGTYRCPVYKTLARQGTLATTGHSTNFILFVELPSPAVDPRKWIKAGVALFCSLRYFSPPVIA